MNNTKKILLILAIVFSFGDVAWSIYDIVSYFQTDVTVRAAIFYLIFTFISLAASIAIIVLLTMAIWNNGKYFRSRYGLYMAALTISIILNLFSITSVFLIVSIFISDWVWIKPEKEVKEDGVIIEYVKKEDKTDTKEEKIASLRKRHEKGEISDEEFQEELTKLL